MKAIKLNMFSLWYSSMATEQFLFEKYPLNMFNCHVWLPKGKHLFPASHIFISTRTGEVRQWLQRSQNSFHLAVLCRCQTLLVGCFNPSEQILVSWDDSSQYMEKKMFQTTNQLKYPQGRQCLAGYKILSRQFTSCFSLDSPVTTHKYVHLRIHIITINNMNYTPIKKHHIHIYIYL